MQLYRDFRLDHLTYFWPTCSPPGLPLLVLLRLMLSFDQVNRLGSTLNIIRVKPESESSAAGLLRTSRSDARFKHSNIPGEIARDVAHDAGKAGERDIVPAKLNPSSRDRLFIFVGECKGISHGARRLHIIFQERNNRCRSVDTLQR